MTKIRASRHLSPASKKWFQEVAASFQMGGDHERVLTMACEAWDMAQEARVILAKEGIVLTSSTGVQKQHPGVMILNSASDRFLKCVTALGLDVDDVPQEIPGRRDHHGGSSTTLRRVK